MLYESLNYVNYFFVEVLCKRRIDSAFVLGLTIS